MFRTLSAVLTGTSIIMLLFSFAAFIYGVLNINIAVMVSFGLLGMVWFFIAILSWRIKY